MSEPVSRRNPDLNAAPQCTHRSGPPTSYLGRTAAHLEPELRQGFRLPCAEMAGWDRRRGTGSPTMYWPDPTGNAAGTNPAPTPTWHRCPWTTRRGYRRWSPGPWRKRSGSWAAGVGATTIRTFSTGANGGTGAASMLLRVRGADPGTSNSTGWPPSPTHGSTVSPSSTPRTCGSPTGSASTIWRPTTSCCSASRPSRRCWPNAGRAPGGEACSFAPRTNAGIGPRCSGACRDGPPAGHPSVHGARSACTTRAAAARHRASRGRHL